MQSCCFACLNLLLVCRSLYHRRSGILVSIENNIPGVPNCLQNIYSTKYSLLQRNFNNSRTETKNTVERPCATKTPKHQNFPTQSLKVGTSRKWPPFVSDRDYFLGWRFYLNFPLFSTSCKRPLHAWSICTTLQTASEDTYRNLEIAFNKLSPRKKICPWVSEHLQ